MEGRKDPLQPRGCPVETVADPDREVHMNDLPKSTRTMEQTLRGLEKWAKELQQEKAEEHKRKSIQRTWTEYEIEEKIREIMKEGK